MNDLIEPHEPLPDCDCGDCARHERNRLRVLLKNDEDAMYRIAQISPDNTSSMGYVVDLVKRTLAGREVDAEYVPDGTIHFPLYGEPLVFCNYTFERPCDKPFMFMAPHTSDEYALDAVLHAAVKQKRRAVVDCGEAGHDDGRCGNASCLGA